MITVVVLLLLLLLRPSAQCRYNICMQCNSISLCSARTSMHLLQQCSNALLQALAHVVRQLLLLLLLLSLLLLLHMLPVVLQLCCSRCRCAPDVFVASTLCCDNALWL
jgi:hypothetical protein